MHFFLFPEQTMAKLSHPLGQKIKRMLGKVQKPSQDQNQRPRITQIQNLCVLFEQILDPKKLPQ